MNRSTRIKDDDAGFYRALREANSRITDRAGGPNAKSRVLIALQAHQMNSTF